MDSSDFLPIAIQALEALEASSAPCGKQRRDAIQALNGFIVSAEKEREENNTRSNYRAHLKEGE